MELNLANQEPFSELGGHPILNFVNTVHHRFREDSPDRLDSYAALVGFCQQAGLLSEDHALNLHKAGEREAAEASVVLRRAIRVREALYRVLGAIIDNRAPEDASWATLQSGIDRMLSQRTIAFADGHFQWRWQEGLEDTPDQVLWPIMWEIAQFLTGGPLDRMKMCPEPDGCGWLFLDRSKNRSRRWCSMKHCGNLAKVKRHYRRHKRP